MRAVRGVAPVCVILEHCVTNKERKRKPLRSFLQTCERSERGSERRSGRRREEEAAREIFLVSGGGGCVCVFSAGQGLDFRPWATVDGKGWVAQGLAGIYRW